MQIHLSSNSFYLLNVYMIQIMAIMHITRMNDNLNKKCGTYCLLNIDFCVFALSSHPSFFLLTTLFYSTCYSSIFLHFRFKESKMQFENNCKEGLLFWTCSKFFFRRTKMQFDFVIKHFSISFCYLTLNRRFFQALFSN